MLYKFLSTGNKTFTLISICKNQYANIQMESFLKYLGILTFSIETYTDFGRNIYSYNSNN